MPSPKSGAPLDAIVEALFEIRFETTLLRDLVVGRLASHWPKMRAQRLPFADIPLPVRQQDPNLAALPILELHDDRRGRVVKIAEHVISYHCVGAYPKWPAFRSELEDFAKFVSSTLSGFRAKRLGLRYINAFSPAEHQVSDVTDLSVEVLVRGTHVLPPILLNYQVNRATDVALTVRLASREFMAQGFRPNTSSVLDFDAFTPGNHRASTPASVLKWLDRAHDAVKAEFAQFVP